MILISLKIKKDLTDPKNLSCYGNINVKVVVHFKKKKLLLIIYSPPCHPRCPCHSFFSRKEIKVFDENIPGFHSI